MDFKQFHQKKLEELPPNLEDGNTFKKIERIEEYSFKYEGKDVKALKVFADGKEYKTTSGVLISTLTDFFKENPSATLDNVKIEQPKGKRYLTLVPA